MGLKNEDFSDEDQYQWMCTWEFFTYIFFGIRKTPTQKIPIRKISTNQTLPWWIPPWKTPTQKIPTHFFKYSHASFLIFFSLLSPLSLMLLERLFCNSMFYECWSLYVSENLSKRSVKWRRQLMKWVGIFQVRIFLGGNFPRGKGFSRGEFYGLEFFGWEFPRGEFP